MPIIEVKTDPQLQFPPIEDPLITAAPEEDSGTDSQQTKMVGIVAPLIKINNVVVPFNDVVSFELSSIGLLPQLSICVNDKFNLIKSLDQPKGDNLIQIQILPRFDGAYKKINMNFFIGRVEMVGSKIYVEGIYKVPELYNSQLKSFGELTTYEYIEQIANETKLGLASNINATDDKRYIYCNNINYVDSIQREVKFGGNETIILDAWIDYWNYINIVDIFERYNANDSGLKVWITENLHQDITTGGDNEPIEVDAKLTNNPNARNSQLYIRDFVTSNNTGSNLDDGTDRVLTIYDNITNEAMETLLQDGDVSNDLFSKYFYLGEKFSEHNYLLSQECNKMYNQKINLQTIQVSVTSPLLGLMRGHKVELIWYDTNDLINLQKEETPETNIPIDEEDREPELPTINTQISGQYLIYKTVLSYNKNSRDAWSYKLTLTRPQSQIKSYVTNGQ